LIELGGVHVQLTNLPGPLVEVRIMAVEPIDTLVWLQVGNVKESRVFNG
jgi:hypothetical protein